MSVFTRLLERLYDAWNSAYFPLNVDRFLNRLASEFSAQYVYQTLQEARDSAATGGVPASITVLQVASHSTPGDGGGAFYARMTAAEIDDLDMTATELGFLSFPDSSGDVWMLNEDQPRFAMIGIFGDPVGAEPTTNCAPATSAMAAYSAFRGGCIWYYDWRNYLFNDHFDMVAQMGVHGPEGQGRDPKFNNDVGRIEATQYQPGLTFATGKSLRYTDSCVLQSLTVRRTGLTGHTDLKGALDFQAFSFTGTLIARAGGGDATGCTFKDINVWGGAIGIDGNKVNSVDIDDIYGDCLTNVIARNAGETKSAKRVKRKPVLTVNESTGARTIKVSGPLFDSGGKVGVTTASSLSAAGLTSGQRIATDKLPEPYPNVRLTVEVLTDTTFRFIDSVWDPAYASYDTTKSDFVFQAGMGWGIQAGGTGIYKTANDKIGVRILGTMPVVPGHWLNFSAGNLPQSRFCKVLDVYTSSDYELDVPWPSDPGQEAALLALDVALVEVAAMPNIRIHDSSTSEGQLVYDLTGGYLGWGMLNTSGAGSFIEGASKGGAGIYVGDGSSTVNFRVESGTVGDAEVDAVGGQAICVTASRTSIFGTYKSNSIGARVLYDDKNSVCNFFGTELVDNRTAALYQTEGIVYLFAPSSRGGKKVIVEDIQNTITIGGELWPEDVTSVAATLAERERDLERTHWINFEEENAYYTHTSLTWRGWVAGALTTFGTLDSTGLTINGAINASNIEAVFSATATTVSTTAQALTANGTAAAGTVSGYAISTNNTSRKLRICIIAVRDAGSETATWEIDAILFRNNNSSQVALTPRSGSLTSRAPDWYYDDSGTDPSTWAVTIAMSGANMVIDATGSSGRTLKWKVRVISDVEAP